MTRIPESTTFIFNRKYLLAGSLCFASLAGCHSAFVQTTVINQTGSTIPLFEVDYPSASFGSSGLQPGATFHYQLKVLGQGPIQVIWTDGSAKEHSVKGPTLHEGEEGSLTVVIAPDNAVWQPRLHDAH